MTNLSEPSTLQTCIFCERTLSLPDPAAAVLPVCRDCLRLSPPPGSKVGLFPPPSVMVRRLRYSAVILLLGLLGCVIGAAVGFLVLSGGNGSTALPVAQSLIFGEISAVLVMLLALPFVFSRIQHAGMDVWKAQLIKKLDLQRVVERPGMTASLGFFCWHRPRWRDMTNLVEMGILLEAQAGLIFCGASGTRTAIPFSEISAVGIERLKLFPPRPSVRIERRVEPPAKPDPVFFTFTEYESFKANREKTLALEKNIREQLSG